ncbi:aminopeptidase [Streptococcus equi subsp. zooepidemicus Sz35]|uniref:aminopeptidase n=1 Tax=Streptococcus equi TaxID=1336 RepID=UPI0005B8D771|nr:aminopeptidase [Streptococcus equi]KIS19613.1 aminopeptidase [Streptococcus equi subsp. zooepidemicus Sz35]MCD3402741.1 aminopeptidase [Streptococcus equi subsp. zooepidemicus]MCD3441813.1 aminopeptidase [Streptococcus equi subsp. zooepidemicus]HEK9990368.1 aminopeptidase [Streptococcus equi subsp. zooepidemicus]HEL0002292.1 aminopeptidase [Streptococcus equi subsp. zooepidemicus]
MVLPHFDDYLEKYANLLIKKGVNIQKGHTLLISIAVEHHKLARLLTKKAYEAGAAEVLVDYNDDQITREKLLKADEDRLLQVPDYVVEQSHYLLDQKASRLVIRSANPNVFADIDSDRLAGATRATAIALEKQRTATQANKVSWNLAAAASPEWAAMVFPKLTTEEEQVDALWDAIFKMNRIYETDPVKAWDQHQERLEKKARLLNNYQFDSLHYRAPGTDLKLGMPEQHIWEAAGSTNAQGEVFIANMPTEEVFTAPDYRRADGYVSSTKPLSYAGVVIEDMTFTFKDGQIVDVTAKKGEDTIKRLISENEGARSLGEVALVPHKTPISLSGLTFFNTLFDENASNHLALGAAYAFSIKGGTEMTNDELKAAGLNRSTAHVDFMIGSEQMDIDGITKDGEVIPIFRGGEWAI